jgi:hypothetical protein
MLTKREVDEFKEIYLRRYGTALTDAEASDMAANLLSLYRTVYPTANMTMKSDHEKKLQPEKTQS